ncbi:hypothetical protein JHN49_14430 [Streptomyces sp. MBT57]|nr:hypothetical protein [Streptomyces sp. MBT57]
MTEPEPAPPTSGDLPIRISYPKAPEGDVVAHFEYEPPGDDWVASGDIQRGERGLVISRLELRPAGRDSSGVTGSLLRRVQVGELLAAARAELARAKVPSSQKGHTVNSSPAKGTAVRRGGRVALTDELLREVAVKYLIETLPSKPSGALSRMSASFGRPEETVRTWVGRARKDGWLGPSVKGRAGAEPGPKLALTAEEMAQIYSDLLEHVVVHRVDPEA